MILNRIEDVLEAGGAAAAAAVLPLHVQDLLLDLGQLVGAGGNLLALHVQLGSQHLQVGSSIQINKSELGTFGIF